MYYVVSIMYKKYSVLIITLYILTTCFLLLSAGKALAQQQQFDISTTPHAFDLTAKPGDTIKKIIRVRNNADTAFKLSVTLKKLIPDTNGKINLVDFTNEDYRSWIKFDNSSVSALPKEWVDIPFTLSIPKTASYGYYYAIMLSSQDKASQPTTPQAKLTGAVAIPVLLSVEKPGASFTGYLTSFVTNESFFEYLPVTFLTTFTNKGNVHTKPHGNIFITDMTGNTVASLTINKDLGSVLPNGSRTFETVWNDSFITYEPKVEDGKEIMDSSGKPEYHMVFHFDRVLHLRIGKYTAHALLVVSTDTKDISYESSTAFWVFPWKIVSGLIIFVILAGIGLFQTGKSIFRTVRKIFKK